MHKILLVDDEIDVLETIEDLIDISINHCEFSRAENGAKAFEICKTIQFDLIITDHNMPELTGFQLIEAIRVEQNKNQSTPILMISAFIDQGLKEKLSTYEIKSLSKPFRSDELITIINSYLV